MDGQKSGAEYYPVHLGIWTNWSRGRIFGPTLTLRRQDADLLIAFTAFFIAIVSTRVWRIVCFAFHRQHATPTQQDVVYHQCQVILRNSSSAETGIRLLTRSMRLATTVVVAAVCIAAFTSAGGFSSQISTTVGTEVLIKSANCGSSASTGFVDAMSSPFLPIIAGAINNAANYAQQCYSNNNTGILNCGRFITKNIVSHIETQADCPFPNSVCRVKSANLRIDSGFINSHDHFGLNSPPNERILTRKILHCAPMKTSGFSGQRATSFGEITVYHYGSMEIGDEVVDYMTTASSISSQYSTTLVPMKDGEPYTHIANFIPIDLISRNDADIYTILLSGNGVLFAAPSSDECEQLYLPLEPGSPLGCVEQFQFCRKDTQNCGPLTSFHDAITGAAPFFNTTHDEAIYGVANTTGAANFAYLINAIGRNVLAGVLTQLGLASLASQSTERGLFQAQLPSNQWQLDVIHWSNIYMAAVQAGFLSTAYFQPTNSPLLGNLRTNFTSPDFLRLCNNQKIRSTSYGSFSLFGLLFTFLVGVLTILTSYLLEPISRALYNRWGYKKYAHLEWTTNATLQLQRLAHEELGFSTWSRGTDEVPATKEGELLGLLGSYEPDSSRVRPGKER
ncbi:hypothetical protein F5B21DRAFT_517984 [Xylaria acuta]|nr:hypothetical protein F5B21DRAFT_517984 [Xylaria acuta]